MEINKALIASVQTNCNFAESALIHHTEEINRAIEESLRNYERKIAQGLKRAQEMRTE